MKPPLKPIKLRRISDQVLDQLRELVLRGELKPGQQIMPERELAAALNVSRTSVRDAISKMVVMGLLEQRQGQGTFVRLPADQQNPLAVAMETQEASLANLLEVRMGLECAAAAYAARRATDEDLRFLEKSLTDMRAEVASGRLGTEADVGFHMAISFASKNPLQVYIMKNFYDYLFYSIRENLAQLYERPGNIESILQQHQAIFEAIRSHDPRQAFEAMQRHIDFVLDFLADLQATG